jgi:ketosteroid isomerase-like protein
MEMSRREAVVLGASGLLLSGSLAEAQSNFGSGSDEAAVTAAVETLRQGIFEKAAPKLASVTAPQLSYGHSAGRIETKDEFITAVINRKATVKALAFPDLKVAVVGNNAIARHMWISESELEGKTTNTKIGVLQVWLKQDGAWKLLARQAYVLPTPA